MYLDQTKSKRPATISQMYVLEETVRHLDFTE